MTAYPISAVDRMNAAAAALRSETELPRLIEKHGFGLAAGLLGLVAVNGLVAGNSYCDPDPEMLDRIIARSHAVSRVAGRADVARVFGALLPLFSGLKINDRAEYVGAVMEDVSIGAEDSGWSGPALAHGLHRVARTRPGFAPDLSVMIGAFDTAQRRLQEGLQNIHRIRAAKIVALNPSREPRGDDDLV